MARELGVVGRFVDADEREQQRLLEVLAVLGLVEDDRERASRIGVGHLLAADRPAGSA